MTFQDVKIDSVREYWDARPCNIKHSGKPVGERDYYLEVRERRYFVEPHIPPFADFGQWEGKKVLEVGCGIGTEALCFAGFGAEVTAVDLSSKSLDIAWLGARVLKPKGHIYFIQADVESLSAIMAPESFDLVYSFGVLHHTPDPDAALAEIYRRVKPGGTLKLMVYHRFSWKVFWILKGRFWRTDELVAQYSEAQTGCPVTYIYSKAEAKSWLERHGFKVEEMFVTHIFPYKISDYKEYRYVKNWYFRWMPKAIFHKLERLFGWHLMITARKETEDE